MMETKSFSVALDKNPRIAINVIPGHFTTSNAHSNNYLEVSELKSNALVARDVARELAIPYISSTLVDTIVCMEKMEVIGAYLAEELLQDGTAVINSGSNIHVISPISNTYGNLIFQDNMTEWIAGKNILLLVASVSSGRTLKSAVECLIYYRGIIAGISSLFAANFENPQQKVHSLFSPDDIAGYKLYSTGECAMCRAGEPLDAIISSDGYTKLTQSQ